jgi:hypothetical protein
MIYDSCGPLSPMSRHLDRVSVREQRYLRLQMSRTRLLRVFAEAELADLDAQPADPDEDDATDSCICIDSSSLG